MLQRLEPIRMLILGDLRVIRQPMLHRTVLQFELLHFRFPTALQQKLVHGTTLRYEFFAARQHALTVRPVQHIPRRRSRNTATLPQNCSKNPSTNRSVNMLPRQWLYPHIQTLPRARPKLRQHKYKHRQPFRFRLWLDQPNRLSHIPPLHPPLFIKTQLHIPHVRRPILPERRQFRPLRIQHPPILQQPPPHTPIGEGHGPIHTRPTPKSPRARDLPILRHCQRPLVSVHHLKRDEFQRRPLPTTSPKPHPLHLP